MDANKGHDPGWNDPPVFSYARATEIQANAAKKGNHLNKRIAFPLSGVKATGGVDPTAAQLPLDLSKITAPPSTAQSCSQSKPPEISESSDDENLVDQLKSVFQCFQVTSYENEEISKRLKIMENMWLDGKLDKEVRRKIKELGLALKNGDFESADHLQKSLMVDHVSVCSTWISGIRQLINQKRTG